MTRVIARSACDEAIHAAGAMDRHAAQERLAMTGAWEMIRSETITLQSERIEAE
ncbi:MAG TPA: hypothetical protein VLJ20_14065 [Acetobacteraceae bacterium]|nr:hypothetical protein [Acetobacteraceae bacterium]